MSQASFDDLDRCVHGRHSIDPCLDCPGGQSTGNLFLISGTKYEPGAAVRIGTTVHGEAIIVVPVRRRGETDS